MEQIKNQIKSELSKVKPNQFLITTLEKVLSSGELSFDDWQASGKFTTVKDFLHYRPTEVLHRDTDNVIEYIGGFYIQTLKDGMHYLNEDCKSYILDEVEYAYWYKELKIIFNK
jgi:hypothetical protein